MKRYFISLFKKLNPKMKLKSNNVGEYLEASESMIKSLEGFISVNEHLKYFIVQMVSSKLTSQFQIDSELEKSLKLLDTCLYSYSDKAMRRIFEDSSSRLLFNYFYKHGHNFFIEQKNVKKNLKEYVSTLEYIYKNFNGQCME